MAALTYSERIAHRLREWWGSPLPGPRHGGGSARHRLAERRRCLDRDVPVAEWACCERWPRILLDKWNAREFAAIHGAALPEMYWRGGPTASIPYDRLPGEFAVRPVRGSHRRGVLVFAGGRELLWGGPGDPESIGAHLSRRSRLRRRTPILIEERIRPLEGGAALPLEVKLHTFGSAVVVVELIARDEAQTDAVLCKTPSWEEVPLLVDTNVRGPDRDPPPGLDEMIRIASSIGAALGTFMRVDFFSGERGPVFNEFSATPDGGHGVTPAAEKIFSDAWAEHCPDGV